MKQPFDKPELLAPAGKPESFWAALEGGADAVYMGLQKFNARARALNFTMPQLQAAVREAHLRQKKVYVTFNTVITNREVSDLLHSLHQIHQIKPDGVIIQDWGVYHLIRSHFPDLTLHASTQMGVHNSSGARFMQQLGFERVILARELTRAELAGIRKKCRVDLELFIHGALCYSFSGQCLFSSYLGGASANRGACTQPCRREYRSGHKSNPFFSLRDNQLISHLAEISRLGIRSLKIEGRIKSAEYAYTVTRAYRLALDHPDRLDEATALLNTDLGREKTAWFFGGSLKSAFTSQSAAGERIGTVGNVDDHGFRIMTQRDVNPGNRIYCYRNDDKSQTAFTIQNVESVPDGVYVQTEGPFPGIGDAVYLAARGQNRFPTKLKTTGLPLLKPLPKSVSMKIMGTAETVKTSGRPRLFLRIDTLTWLPKIPLNHIEELILKPDKKDWDAFDPDTPFLQANKQKISIELPKFMAEGAEAFYRTHCQRLAVSGFRRFIPGHLSQKILMPPGAVLTASENIPVFNDPAARLLSAQGIKDYISPFENDLDNLFRSKLRHGIIPLYYYPELFYSRMPVPELTRNGLFHNSRKEGFRKIVRDGMTAIIPDKPVALFQYKTRLADSGYHRFLIDLSHTPPSRHLLNKLLSHYHEALRLPDTVSFNFKRGLK